MAVHFELHSNMTGADKHCSSSRYGIAWSEMCVCSTSMSHDVVFEMIACATEAE